ncbi:MAG: hypothetical protein WCA89_08945 [Terracidiphilus sp.]|jgi:hypothetical protein
MRNFILLPLATLLALTSVACGQSGNFTVAQHGKPVGTASFNVTALPTGYDSTTQVNIKMDGLDYTLSKTERLSLANHLRHAQLNASVNSSAVTVTAAPGPKTDAIPSLVLNISANGNATTTPLPAHPGAVFLPDFDPGALETLLALGVAQNNRDLWAIIPKKAGTIEPVQLATYADEQGTLDGKPIVVHHLVATIAGSSTDLFSGPENQLLQAELPQKGFALVRKNFVLTPPAKPAALPAEKAD